MSGNISALDGEYEFDDSGVVMMLKYFKRSFMRKNSSKPVRVMLRCNHSNPRVHLWTYTLECWQGGKLVSTTRITKDVFDGYEKIEKYEKAQYQGTAFITLEEFTPTKKQQVS